MDFQNWPLKGNITTVSMGRGLHLLRGLLEVLITRAMGFCDCVWCVTGVWDSVMVCDVWGGEDSPLSIFDTAPGRPSDGTLWLWEKSINISTSSEEIISPLPVKLYWYIVHLVTHCKHNNDKLLWQWYDYHDKGIVTMALVHYLWPCKMSPEWTLELACTARKREIKNVLDIQNVEL